MCNKNKHVTYGKLQVHCSQVLLTPVSLNSQPVIIKVSALEFIRYFQYKWRQLRVILPSPPSPPLPPLHLLH